MASSMERLEGVLAQTKTIVDKAQKASENTILQRLEKSYVPLSWASVFGVNDGSRVGFLSTILIQNC